MKNILYFFFLIIFFCGLNATGVYSQSAVDSIMNVIEEDSIVYIDEPAVFIQRTIVEEQVIYNNWFLEASLAGFIHSNSHLICEECIEYKEGMINSTRPLLGNFFGLKLFYAANKSNFVYGLGVSNTFYREKFNHIITNSKDLNRYNYADLSIGTGYWLNRKKKVGFIVNVDLIYSRLISKEGSMLDYVDLYKVINIEEIDRYARNLVSGRAGIKVLFLNHKRVKFFLEPYTRVNFTSVLNYKENYYWRRWSHGIGIGFLYVL